MKTLLIYPPSESVYGLPRYPTLGITYLATVLKEKGFSVAVLDMRFPQNNLAALKRRLVSFKPDLVGVGSTSFDFPGAVKVFQAVKRFSPSTITLLGGPHATVCSPEAIKEKEIDYFLLGEGEETLPQLLKALKSGRGLKKVRGLIYRTAQGKTRLTAAPVLIKDLDALPFPRWDLFSLNDYQVRGKLTLPLMTSRGCPFNCVYCVSWKTHGRGFRVRSPKNVVDEIENDMARYDARKFSFLDDNFTLDPQRALEICQEIIKRKLKISWTCDQGVRADRVNKKLFQTMKKSGCRLVALGVESADQDVLDEMEKGEKVEAIRQAIKEAKEAGLIVKAFFIVGGPGDSFVKTEKSIQFFKETGVDIPRFGMMTAYPGSRLWQWVEKNGRFLANPYKHILESPTVADKVQFETKDFPKKERLRAFRLADKEAEIWAIRQKLVRGIGPFFGQALLPFFHWDFLREMVKKIYRLRLFSAAD